MLRNYFHQTSKPAIEVFTSFSPSNNLLAVSLQHQFNTSMLIEFYNNLYNIDGKLGAWHGSRLTLNTHMSMGFLSLSDGYKIYFDIHVMLT